MLIFQYTFIKNGLGLNTIAINKLCFPWTKYKMTIFWSGCVLFKVKSHYIKINKA